MKAKSESLKIVFEKNIDGERDADREILLELKKQGDNPNIVRPVFHYCLFDDKKKLKLFLEQLKGTQIIVCPTKRPLGAVVTMASDMIENHIFNHIDIVSATIEKAGGKYDGWETQITK